MNDSFKKKLIINGAITLGVAVALVVMNFIISSSISKKAEQIQQFKRELNSRTHAIESLVLLKKDRAAAAGYVNFLDNFFPNGDEIITFRRDLQSLALKHKLNFTFAFVGESSAEEGKIGSIGFQMSVGGKPEAFLNFVKDMESTRYVMNFDAIDYTSASKGFTAKFTGKVFLE